MGATAIAGCPHDSESFYVNALIAPKLPPPMLWYLIMPTALLLFPNIYCIVVTWNNLCTIDLPRMD